MEWSRLPVFKRLIPSVRKRMAGLRPPHRYRLVKRGGARFLVNFANWGDRMVITQGFAEPDQVRYLLQEIQRRRCGVFLDIGAHMGTYAIIVGHKIPDIKIIAFEPDPRNYAHLQANLLVNNFLGVIESRAEAVSDRDGSVAFILGPATGSNVSRVGEASASTMLVSAVRLDSVVSSTQQNIALKIDIEGHESRALAGMRGLLQNNRCFMQVECFDEAFPAFKEAMAQIGYRLVHQIGVDRYFAN